MKIDAKLLVKLIREVVQDEVKKALPGLVRECLTENYIKKLVSEQASFRSTKSALEEAMEDEPDEDVPEPLGNSHRGIYNKSHLIKGQDDEEEESERMRRPNEHVAKLLAPTNPLSSIYEGVNRLPADKAIGLPSIPIEKMGLDNEKMRALAGLQKTTRQETSREPEARRFDPTLDTPVGGGARQQPQPHQRLIETARTSHPNIDGDVFPDRPITFDE